MNIVEAFVKIKGHLIVLISGLSGSGKTRLGQNISKLFNMKLINEKDYLKKNYGELATLPNNVKIINWDSDDIYDWEKLNEDILRNSKKGVIVTGSAFPANKLEFTADFHIHIKLSKQNILKRRLQHSEKHKKEHDIAIQQIIFNNLTYPYYIDAVSRSNINKFINSNDYMISCEEAGENCYDDKIYDSAFDYLMDQIGRNIYNN